VRSLREEVPCEFTGASARIGSNHVRQARGDDVAPASGPVVTRPGAIPIQPEGRISRRASQPATPPAVQIRFLSLGELRFERYRSTCVVGPVDDAVVTSPGRSCRHSGGGLSQCRSWRGRHHFLGCTLADGSVAPMVTRANPSRCEGQIRLPAGRPPATRGTGGPSPDAPGGVLNGPKGR
jgi:hypothetical protein